MFLQSAVFKCLQLDSKLKTHCNLDYTNKSESIYKRFAKIYIKFQQIKIDIYTSIIDLEFSMSFANLFIGLLAQRSLVFSSKRALLHITCHHFGHLKLLYKSFLLITSPNLSSFCRRVPYIHCGLLLSPYFWIQMSRGLHYLSLHNTKGRFFQFMFSGHNDQFQQVTYGHLFVVQ